MPPRTEMGCAKTNDICNNCAQARWRSPCGVAALYPQRTDRDGTLPNFEKERSLTFRERERERETTMYLVLTTGTPSSRGQISHSVRGKRPPLSDLEDVTPAVLRKLGGRVSERP